MCEWEQSVGSHWNEVVEVAAHIWIIRHRSSSVLIISPEQTYTFDFPTTCINMISRKRVFGEFESFYCTDCSQSTQWCSGGRERKSHTNNLLVHCRRGSILRVPFNLNGFFRRFWRCFFDIFKVKITKFSVRLMPRTLLHRCRCASARTVKINK